MEKHVQPWRAEVRQWAVLWVWTAKLDTVLILEDENDGVELYFSGPMSHTNRLSHRVRTTQVLQSDTMQRRDE